MRKRIVAALLLCGILLMLAACGGYTIPDGTPPPAQNTVDNPFEEQDTALNLGAALSHMDANPRFSGNNEKLPYEYSGGELELDYKYSLTGKLDAVGFLLFLDGKPQPYKVNNAAGDYEYCHSFPADEDTTFIFLFEPVTGKAGNTLTLTVVSITNPDFRPDMQTTSGYGWYHKTLDANISLHFNVDAPTDTDFPTAPSIFSQVNTQEIKATAQYVETELPKHGWNGVSMDTLDNGIYYTVSYDDKIVYDNLCVSSPVNLKFTMCGAAGTGYSISFFLDHRPVRINGNTSYPITLNKGGVMEIRVEIDPDTLGPFNTFYCLAVPQSSAAMTFAPFYKTNSILLYKEN